MRLIPTAFSWNQGGFHFPNYEPYDKSNPNQKLDPINFFKTLLFNKITNLPGNWRAWGYLLANFPNLKSEYKEIKSV